MTHPFLSKISHKANIFGIVKKSRLDDDEENEVYNREEVDVDIENLGKDQWQGQEEEDNIFPEKPQSDPSIATDVPYEENIQSFDPGVNPAEHFLNAAGDLSENSWWNRTRNSLIYTPNMYYMSSGLSLNSGLNYKIPAELEKLQTLVDASMLEGIHYALDTSGETYLGLSTFFKGKGKGGKGQGKGGKIRSGEEKRKDQLSKYFLKNPKNMDPDFAQLLRSKGYNLEEIAQNPNSNQAKQLFELLKRNRDEFLVPTMNKMINDVHPFLDSLKSGEVTKYTTYDLPEILRWVMTHILYRYGRNISLLARHKLTDYVEQSRGGDDSAEEGGYTSAVDTMRSREMNPLDQVILNEAIEQLEGSDKAKGQEFAEGLSSAVPEEAVVQQMSGQSSPQQRDDYTLQVVHQLRKTLDGLRKLTNDVIAKLNNWESPTKGASKKAVWVKILMDASIRQFEKIVDREDKDVLNNIKINDDGTVDISYEGAGGGRSRIKAELGANGVPDNFSNWYTLPSLDDLTSMAKDTAQRKQQIKKVVTPLLGNMNPQQATQETFSRLLQNGVVKETDHDFVSNTVNEILHDSKAFDEFQEEALFKPIARQRMNWKDWFPSISCALLESSPNYDKEVISAFVDIMGFGTSSFSRPTPNKGTGRSRCFDGTNVDVYYKLRGFDLQNLQQYIPKQEWANSDNPVLQYRYRKQMEQYKELSEIASKVHTTASVMDPRIITSYGIFNRAILKISKLRNINIKLSSSNSVVHQQLADIIAISQRRIMSIWS